MISWFKYLRWYLSQRNQISISQELTASILCSLTAKMNSHKGHIHRALQGEAVAPQTEPPGHCKDSCALPSMQVRERQGYQWKVSSNLMTFKASANFYWLKIEAKVSLKRPSLTIRKVPALGNTEARKPAQSPGFQDWISPAFKGTCVSLSPWGFGKPRGASGPRCPAQTGRRLCYPSPF